MSAPLDYNTVLQDIKKLSGQLQKADKKSKLAIRKRLRSRLGIFFDRFVRVRVRRANNEKHPWLDSEIGLECVGMETKNVTGLDQVGDYNFEISIGSEAWINLGLCIERKEKEDAHGTFLFHLDRFANEIDRFKAHPYLKTFRIVIECNLEEFLDYTHPLPKICKCCDYCHAYHDTHNDVHKFSCNYDVLAKRAEMAKVVRPTYRCRFYKPPMKTIKELEDLRNRKLAIIEGFEAEGYSVSFYTDRRRAAGAVKTIVKRYFVANYARLLL